MDAGFLEELEKQMDKAGMNEPGATYTWGDDDREYDAATGTPLVPPCPLQTFGARLIVEARDGAEERTSSGGILIPQTADADTHAEGRVVAVGEGLLLQDGSRVALPIAVGDRVLYRKHAGARVKRDGREWVVLDLENLLAAVRQGAPGRDAGRDGR